MKTISSCLLLFFALWLSQVVANSIVVIEDEFHEFVVKYSKQYSEVEYTVRHEIYKENLKKINEHNSKPGVSFFLGVNEHADMTHAEFLKAKTSKEHTFASTDKFAHQSSLSIPQAPPASLDWRTNKDPLVVLPVKDQGQCGSAGVFAIVDSIASDYAVISQDDAVSFDYHYVTDCDGEGCSGQLSNVVWSFIAKYGLNWYYNGCPTGPGLGLCISGNNCTKSGNEVELQSAVATHGPIPVMIDASRNSFQLYSSGIYYEPACSSTQLDHTVLLVGYGSTNGQDYWIARNSWGTGWGQKGDILLARNRNNNCGVATAACYAQNVRTCVCKI